MLTLTDDYKSVLDFLYKNERENIYAISTVELTLKNVINANVYIQKSDRIDSAITVLNKTAYVYFEKGNFSEIDEFFKYRQDINTVIGRLNGSQLSDFEKTDRVMYSFDNIDKENEGVVLSNNQIKDAYNMLMNAGFNLPEYDVFYSDRFYLNKYFDCKMYGIYDNDKLVCTAGEVHRTLSYVMISGVCTDNEYRNRGLAKKLISFINQNNTSKCVLICKNENAKNFYKKINADEISFLSFFTKQ